MSFPDSLPGWSIGAAEAPIRMTLIFDYANPYTPWLDEVARKVAERHPEVQLQLVLFPLSKSLNPRFGKWGKDFYGASTEMARLAQTSSDLGGDAAFLSMHAPSINQSTVSDDERMIALASSDGRLAVYQMDGSIKKPLAFVRLPVVPASVSFSADGNRLVTPFAGGNCTVWTIVDSARLSLALRSR